jgi:serine/threonine-protein kinase
MMAMSLLAGRYELRARIGAGGYGEVWRGRDNVLARPVAVKLLQAEHTLQPEAMHRFRAEARHAGALSHPCIAHVYDYCEPAPPDPPFLVMELVDGPSLAELLSRGPLEVPRAMDVIAQAAAGLDAAHQAGVVHRDIKPGNLLIGRNGPVKLTDFGIAQAQVPAVSGPVTMTGMVLGTAGYMAPERIEGSQATVASDLYALGVVAHECLAGLLPRNGGAAGSGSETDAETDGRPAFAPRSPPLPPLPASVPPDVAALVGRLTARDPARRPATAGEVARQAAGLRDRYRNGDRAAALAAASALTSAMAADPAIAGDPAAAAGVSPDGPTPPGGTPYGLSPPGWSAYGPTPPGGSPYGGSPYDGSPNGAGSATRHDRAGPVPVTGPDRRPDGRTPERAGPRGRWSGRPRGWRPPTRTMTAIAAGAVAGLGLLTFGIIEATHPHGPTVSAGSGAGASGGSGVIDIRASSLIGQQVGAVRRQLVQDGLVVRIIWQDSFLMPGQVLAVQPSGALRRGSVVLLTVARAATPGASRGPGPGQLPLLPGTGTGVTTTPTKAPKPGPDQSPAGSTSPAPSGSPSSSGSPSASTSPSTSPSSSPSTSPSGP